MRGILATIAVLSALTGCSTSPAVHRIPFPDEEYKVLPKEGTGVVSGQAFLRTRGGDVKTAAGSVVRLNPVTSFSKQWFDVVYRKKQKLAAMSKETEQRLKPYLLETVADADGRFTFEEVPPGSYYAVSYVFWEYVSDGVPLTTGGYICRQIEVENGSETKIILTEVSRDVPRQRASPRTRAAARRRTS